MAEEKESGVPGQPGEESEMTEAEIDRTLAESFPASDPPSWTLGTDHSESTTPAEPDGDSTEE